MFVCPECGGSQPIGGHCPFDGLPLAEIGEDVLLGTTIGAYRVARLLGIGGMGRVYKGVHPTIGSRVAIKVLSRECTDRRDLVERFFAEARAVNLIRHESIVNVLDLAMLPDGRPYIIMEYLDGAPLAAIVEHAQLHQHQLPLGGLARLAVEVLDALGAAHAKGIVHRDLKPDNVFVAPSGRPKVLDFGIARFTDQGGSGSATRTGSLLGTPHYMSPEQAAGRPVDHRADLYAMGVILFECATGRKPFAAESLFELLRKHVEEPAPSPRLFRPEIDAGLEEVILCALAKSPDERFATAQAMSLALQQATAHLPPDQWTPITGSGVHRATPSGGAWQPTPPASWGSRVAPRPSEPPIGTGPTHRDPRPPPIGNLSTVSASSGQIQRAAADRPRSKAVWIGVVAALVIGGGITAVVVNQGSEPSVETEQVGATPSDPVPEPAPAPTPTLPAAPDLSAVTTGIEAQIAEATRDLPDDVKRQVEAATSDALRKVKDATNQPTRRPVQVERSAPDQLEADDPTANRVTAVVPPAPGRWVEDRTLTPAGWNPRRVDVARFIQFALAEARKAVPDARLTRISVDGVTPDGFANLELPTLASSTGDIELRFISPSRSKPDPKAPAGLPIKLECEFRISGGPEGVEMRPDFPSSCKTITVPPPRCTVTQLWQLAIRHKAPTNAVANISYYRGSMHPSARFFFDIGFGHDKVFGQAFTDADCR
jgi:serine/threonine protein kinase